MKLSSIGVPGSLTLRARSLAYLCAFALVLTACATQERPPTHTPLGDRPTVTSMVLSVLFTVLASFCPTTR